MAQQAPTVKDAINVAAAGAGRNDLILVTGSFAIAGEAKRLFSEKKRAATPTPEPKPASDHAPRAS
jgi:folylpolyglutamate synthase/dihydropteroate synthase